MGKISDSVADAKAWWKSKTIIGSILLFLPALLKILLPETDVDVQGAVDTAWEGAEGIAAYADSIWASIQEAIGFVLIIYGRLKAQVGIKSSVL